MKRAKNGLGCDNLRDNACRTFARERFDYFESTRYPSILVGATRTIINTVLSAKMGTAKVALHFSSWPTPELLRTSFYHPLLRGDHIESSRSSVVPHGDTRGIFKWSSGVKALCALLVNHSLSSSVDPCSPYGRMSGEAGSAASALDYAISKRPAWLLDMFGIDSEGQPLAHRIFRRINGERKRPGPVTIFVNDRALEARDVSITVGDTTIQTRKDLNRLACALDNQVKQESIPPIPEQSSSPTISTQMPVTDEFISAELRSITQVVEQNISNPYIALDAPEVWSAADAVLGLINNPNSSVLTQDRMLELLPLFEPRTDGGFTIEESGLAVPVITATCAMALAELQLRFGDGTLAAATAKRYLKSALQNLVQSQAKSGWWTIVSSPDDVILHEANARVWDTAYTLLALSQVRLTATFNNSSDTIASENRARDWLIEKYDPTHGWTNAPSLPFRYSSALNTFVHFVLVYTQRTEDDRSRWSPRHARGHLESINTSIEWLEELDKHEYRIAGASGSPLPHPHHINHLAFLLALVSALEQQSFNNQTNLTLQIPWDFLFTQLSRSKAIYTFSQVLQGAYFFSRHLK